MTMRMDLSTVPLRRDEAMAVRAAFDGGAAIAL
jgi:hypothetical protein